MRNFWISQCYNLNYEHFATSGRVHSNHIPYGLTVVADAFGILWFIRGGPYMFTGDQFRNRVPPSCRISQIPSFSIPGSPCVHWLFNALATISWTTVQILDKYQEWKDAKGKDKGTGVKRPLRFGAIDPNMDLHEAVKTLERDERAFQHRNEYLEGEVERLTSEKEKKEAFKFGAGQAVEYFKGNTMNMPDDTRKLIKDMKEKMG